MPAANPITYATALTHTLSLLGVTDAYASTSGDGAHPDGEVGRALLASDARVFNAILTNPDHGSRQTLMSVSADLVNGAALPEHVGALGPVEVQTKAGDANSWLPALRSSIAKITLWLNNVALFGSTETLGFPYYELLGGYIFFLGALARVKYGRYTEMPGALQSPAWAFDTVVALALEMLFAKAGEDASTAQHYGRIGAGGLVAIEQGRTEVPKLLPAGQEVE